MPEEATPEAPEQEQVQDTPTETAPTEDTPSQEEQVDYEQRYNDLRPKFDQTTQEREQARQEALAWQILASSEDDDQLQAAAEYLGVELEPEDDETDEGPDPYDERLSQLEQAQQAQMEAENQKAFDSHLDELAGKAEVELTEYDRRALQATSEENGFSPEATEEAFEKFVEERKAYEKSVIDGYVKSKKGAPHVSPVGANANEQPDLDDRQTRQQWMTERLEMGRQQ